MLGLPGEEDLQTKRSEGLLYITESPDSLDYKAFARALNTEPIGLRTLTVTDIRNDPNIVFDVDLRSTATMKRLSELFARPGLGCRIFLTDLDTSVTRANARLLGAHAVLPTHTKPDAIYAAIEAHFGISSTATARRSIDAGAKALDQGFASLAKDEAFDTAGAENASGLIADAIDDVGINQWLATVRGHHVGTFQHCMLVTATASAFARHTGMRRRDVMTITTAGLLHDIGKASVPLDILDKSGALTPEEMQVMRQHPLTGYDYLARRSDIAKATLRSVRSHHEYLDGTGYPDGLSGQEIDDLTRIVTIADIYGAMVERRAYKPPKSPQEALEVIVAMADAGKLEKALVREFGRIMVPQMAAASSRLAG